MTSHALPRPAHGRTTPSRTASALRALCLATLPALACLASPAAQASYLEGSTFFYNPLAPDHPDPLGGPYAATVGAGVEFDFLIGPSGTRLGSIDVQDQAIRIQFDQTGHWHHVIMQFDIDAALAPLTDVQFGAETSLLYSQNAGLSFSDHRIELDVSWLQINQNLVVLDLNPSAVPEPESAAMLLAGLGCLGWVARRRRRHPTAPQAHAADVSL